MPNNFPFCCAETFKKNQNMQSSHVLSYLKFAFHDFNTQVLHKFYVSLRLTTIDTIDTTNKRF